MRGIGRLRRGLVFGFLVFAGASALAAVVAVSGSGAGAATPTLDHFQCYAAGASATGAAHAAFPNTPSKVLVKNKFSTGGFVVAPGAVQMHCNPTQKTVVSGGKTVVTPITNADAHLVCAAIDPKGLKLPTSVTVKNQFGTGAFTPTAVQSLCLPSWTTDKIPVRFPTATAPPNLDAYLCYSVVHASGTPAFKPPASVRLLDQFGPVTTSVGAANILCIPSTETVGTTTPKIVNPDGWVTCFAIPSAGPVVTRTVYDKNQFGIGTVKTTRNTEVCLPSTKVAVTLPTTTTTLPPTTTTAPGVVTSFSSPGVAGPYDIAAGSDGALWFTNYVTNTIGRLTTDGTFSIFGDPSIKQPDGIAEGADGNVWFANTAGDSIGRIAPDGTVTSFSGQIAAPYRVGAGPGNRMWFTNSSSNSVGFVTADGLSTAFSDLNINNPQGITAGPDGAMWFANFYGNSIGRVAPDGTVTTYSAASVFFPLSIVAGSDGALWFTCPGNSTIGRITTSGDITSYSGPNVAGPIDITSGSDGALWFTNYTNNTIGRISTDGIMTSFGDPTIASPDGIASGPDGGIWFTNTGTNTIGRIGV